MVARAEPITTGDQQRFAASPLWAGGALVSLVLLGVFAPSGLLLLMFLGLIILSHEGGHLLAARASGMKPTEFFWGFGPEVVAFTHNGCRYGIKALFLGGYVKLEGMTPTSELPDGFAEAGTYRAASHRGRLATILAGPAVNIATAIVTFTFVALRKGDSIGAAVRIGFVNTWYVIESTFAALGVLFANLGSYVNVIAGRAGTEDVPVRFLSPVGQAQVSGNVVELGWNASLMWLGILSCAVGVINLVPMPPLDGSHALIAFGEGVAQRLFPNKKIAFNVARMLPLAYITVAVLVVLSLSALVLDIRDL